MPTTTPTDMLTGPEIARLVGVSCRTIRRWRAEGGMPKPTVVVAGTRAWERATVAHLFAVKKT